MTIPFTQYVRREWSKSRYLEREGGFDVDPKVEVMAMELFEAGFRFGCEVLPSGSIYLECVGAGVDLANEDSENGPAVLAAVERLVIAAHSAYSAKKAEVAE